MALRKNELRVKWKKKVRKVSGAIIWRAKNRSSGGLVSKSCPTLVTPCSLPGSSVRGILQARILEWVAISFSNGKVKVESLSHVRLFMTPWTVACQAPLSMGFFRQEYWNGLPFPSPIVISLPKCKIKC